MRQTGKLKLKLIDESDNAEQNSFNFNFQQLEAYATSLVQVCSAHTPATMGITQTHKQVQFGAITKNGPAFALSGGGVKVTAAGFAIVSINVNLYDLGSEDRVSADVCKNGSPFYQYSTELSYGWEATLVQTTKIIPVVANDIITVKVWNDTEAKGQINAPASWMTMWYFKNLNF
ncbi:hypothetical protein FIC87_11360 [Eggerthella lenta]|uniref:Uncharacterized protein n=1 Tax=Eggerthella lenta TaxID=84112 RepID=A0A5C5BRI8_EGGLN|nr:hypothetical protein [Eggerthella lenta]TNU89389.1 hypothetical protein FIC87_11360 [Eggerthella lenta]